MRTLFSSMPQRIFEVCEVAVTSRISEVLSVHVLRIYNRNIVDFERP